MQRGDTIKQQGVTGQSTEQKVRGLLKAIGLEAEKPIPDKGVDLKVWHPENINKKLYIQIKGRGKTQKNRRYRWFQIRTTEKQRSDAVKSELSICEAWQKKANLCDFFVLVSEKHEEYWVFPKDIVRELVTLNKIKYGEREDNKSGKQAELDLDIEHEGRRLTEIYKTYMNNFELVREELKNA
jgi:hypothetical protein